MRRLHLLKQRFKGVYVKTTRKFRQREIAITSINKNEVDCNPLTRYDKVSKKNIIYWALRYLEEKTMSSYEWGKWLSEWVNHMKCIYPSPVFHTGTRKIMPAIIVNTKHPASLYVEEIKLLIPSWFSKNTQPFSFLILDPDEGEFGIYFLKLFHSARLELLIKNNNEIFQLTTLDSIEAAVDFILDTFNYEKSNIPLTLDDDWAMWEEVNEPMPDDYEECVTCKRWIAYGNEATGMCNITCQRVLATDVCTYYEEFPDANIYRKITDEDENDIQAQLREDIENSKEAIRNTDEVVDK